MARLGAARHALGCGGPVSRRAGPGRCSRCAATNRGRVGVRGFSAGMVSRRRPVVRRRPRRMVEPPPLARRRAPVHVSGRARVRKAAVAARHDDVWVRRERMRHLRLAQRRCLAAGPARPGRRTGPDPAAVDEHRFARGRWIDRRVHRGSAGPERRGGERRSRLRRRSHAPRIEHALDRRGPAVAPRRNPLSHRRRPSRRGRRGGRARVLLPAVQRLVPGAGR